MELLIDVMYLLCLVSSISLVALKGVSEIYKILQVALLSKPSPNPNPIPNPNPSPKPNPNPNPNPNLRRAERERGDLLQPAQL